MSILGLIGLRIFWIFFYFILAKLRGVLSTQANMYDGDFLEKLSTTKSHALFSQKTPS